MPHEQPIDSGRQISDEDPKNDGSVPTPLIATPAGMVIRDVLILVGLTFGAGLIIVIIGPAFASRNVSKDQFIWLLMTANIVGLTFGFTLAAARCPGNRWKHVIIVALVFWLSGLLVLFVGHTLVDWFLQSIPITITMALGGALSYLKNSQVADDNPKTDERL